MKRIIGLILVFSLSISLSACGNGSSNTNDNEYKAETVAELEDTTNTDVNNMEEDTTNTDVNDIEKDTTNIGFRDESLKGRGTSDYGRSEPNYENIIGYVSIHGYSDLEYDTLPEAPWTVPTYEKDKQFYVENGTVEHKTEVRVINQELEHRSHGFYDGYLLVERLDTKEQFYIDVSNFITNPYWTNNLEESNSIEACLAEFNQISDYYPVDKSNNKVELNDGMKVLIVGKTGLYGGSGPDKDTNSIEAIVYKEWKYGYGGVRVFFNAEDLSVIY